MFPFRTTDGQERALTGRVRAVVTTGASHAGGQEPRPPEPKWVPAPSLKANAMYYRIPYRALALLPACVLVAATPAFAVMPARQYL